MSPAKRSATIHGRSSIRYYRSMTGPEEKPKRDYSMLVLGVVVLVVAAVVVATLRYKAQIRAAALSDPLEPDSTSATASAAAVATSPIPVPGATDLTGSPSTTAPPKATAIASAKGAFVTPGGPHSPKKKK
jgi:hypothetical protein